MIFVLMQNERYLQQDYTVVMDEKKKTHEGTRTFLFFTLSTIYLSLFVCLFVCMLAMSSQTRDFWEGERVLMGVLDLWMVKGYFSFQSDVYFL